MSILKEVLAELFKMFVADARLTVAILITVLISAGLMMVPDLPALMGGLFLLVGCIGVLVASVLREARRRKA
jgi:hypothetical protein